MVEQFNEGDVAVRTKWLFNDQDEVVKEVTEFFEDSSVYTVLYERDGHLISQKQTKIKKGEFTCEYVIWYNERGGITDYSYSHNLSGRKEKYLLKTERTKDNSILEVTGFVNNEAINFRFSYSANTIKIVRKNAKGVKTTFKLVMF